ncbi:hypothetical protein BDM02DRAFT_3111487 [Thelephora ganbajun]|uniref:Uncharacterized protein n=1 Tax=Thelephora ganbajun TaxID=370292 RepID=A0ACB6ZML7_THEGA|nr:hypothetical protein BDM02DRAFT_3111487 [Thelephora ganbajun]
MNSGRPPQDIYQMRSLGGAVIYGLAQSVLSLCTALLASCVFECRLGVRVESESLSIIAIPHPPSCSRYRLRDL